MKKERFKSNMHFVYIVLGAIAVYFWAGGFRSDSLNNLLVFIVLAGSLFLVAYLSTIRTYLEIQDNRQLINSGYRTFGKDRIDIFDIKYIYRFSNFRLKWYGSRMVFYIEMPNGKLHQSSLREVNYSNDTLRDFLKRIKQIKPSIELDPEYVAFLEEKLYLEDASENTVASVEARLKAKGETWE